VLHTPPYSHASFTARLFGLLALAGPRTSMEVALEEGMTVALAKEMIYAAENDGHVCRDGGEEGGEERWWRNIFEDFVWDGDV
jgi:ESCRT-II complex subunit VPS36